MCILTDNHRRAPHTHPCEFCKIRPKTLLHYGKRLIALSVNLNHADSLHDFPLEESVRCVGVFVVLIDAPYLGADNDLLLSITQ